jgi:hypothetical protein
LPVINFACSGLLTASQRRGVTPFVDEFVGPQVVEVTQQIVLQKLRMQLSDAVYVLASNARKMGHADEFVPGLINDGHACHFSVIAALRFSLQNPLLAENRGLKSETWGTHSTHSGGDELVG